MVPFHTGTMHTDKHVKEISSLHLSKDMSTTETRVSIACFYKIPQLARGRCLSARVFTGNRSCP